MSFGETLREVRLLAGLSQQALSDRTTIPKRTIESWEAGTRVPPGYVQYLLLKELQENLSENSEKCLTNRTMCGKIRLKKYGGGIRQAAKDKAMKCNHCGFDVRYCPNCGGEFPGNPKTTKTKEILPPSDSIDEVIANASEKANKLTDVVTVKENLQDLLSVLENFDCNNAMEPILEDALCVVQQAVNNVLSVVSDKKRENSSVNDDVVRG